MNISNAWLTIYLPLNDTTPMASMQEHVSKWHSIKIKKTLTKTLIQACDDNQHVKKVSKHFYGG